MQILGDIIGYIVLLGLGYALMLGAMRLWDRTIGAKKKKAAEEEAAKALPQSADKKSSGKDFTLDA
jgi:hypothetical protein